MSQLVFIGPMNLGHIPSAGDSVKNQLFMDRFVQVYDSVLPIDTADWKKKPWILITLIVTLLFHRKAKVIISANPGSADKLIQIINKLHLPNDVFYWVVGGSFHTMIQSDRLSADTYMHLKRIFVQGKSMVEALEKLGLKNAVYVPNSKLIDHYGEKKVKIDEKVHFVFISRVEEYKGCSDIMECLDILNEQGYEGRYDVTFYGRESEDVNYRKKFQAMVDSHRDVSYKGLLNLRDTKNYDVLAEYDVMLFPTYWHGEGFPGIVIDAYISSLPIIASDWNLNKDVIEDGVTGWIIPVHDVNALAERMEYVINHPDDVSKMGDACKNRAALYDSRVVLSEENLKKMGLL